jgi:L-asparaginase
VDRKSVLVIHTGGTLGMATPAGTRLELAPTAHLERLLARVPELSEIADIELIAPWNEDSSDLGPDHWQRLARLCVERGGVGAAGGFDGIVVIHGTDTMAYAASALAFLLRGLDRPVVFTGSQRPLEAWRTDARANLAAAVECATRPLPEVLIVFGDVVLRGCRATKHDAHDYQAFSTPNAPPLGRIGVGLDLDLARVRLPQERFRLELDLAPEVIALTVFPGFDPAGARPVLAAAAQAGRLRAVIVRAFGVGNVPSHGDKSLVPLVRDLAAMGVAVVVTSQCHRARTDLRLYEGGRALLDAGACEAHDMTFEATLCKTMWALGHARQASVAQWFQRDVAGEVTLG